MTGGALVSWLSGLTCAECGLPRSSPVHVPPSPSTTRIVGGHLYRPRFRELDEDTFDRIVADGQAFRRQYDADSAPMRVYDDRPAAPPPYRAPTPATRTTAPDLGVCAPYDGRHRPGRCFHELAEAEADLPHGLLAWTEPE